MRNISLKIVATALLIAAIDTSAAADYATSSSPLAFGPDQTTIDLDKVNTWSPLELEGFPGRLMRPCPLISSPTARRGLGPHTYKGMTGPKGCSEPARSE
jgi:hypothetical protein